MVVTGYGVPTTLQSKLTCMSSSTVRGCGTFRIMGGTKMKYQKHHLIPIC